LSGCYVNGRTVEEGSAESRDPEKIAMTVAVSRELLAEWMLARPVASPAAPASRAR
jgi:hypothetical protein